MCYENGCYEIFSFILWLWAYFTKGRDAAASSAPPLIRRCP